MKNKYLKMAEMKEEKWELTFSDEETNEYFNEVMDIISLEIQKKYNNFENNLIDSSVKFEIPQKYI